MEAKVKKIIWVILFLIILSGLASFYYLKKQSYDLVKNYHPPKLIKTLDSHYDVIVIGGEPEGVAAAVSAARNGAKTLLVEHREELGGLFTYGMLNFLDIPQGEDGKSVSKGIFEEWHQLVGRQSTFGITEAKAAFKKLVDDEENVTLLTQTEVVKPIVENKKIVAVELKNIYGTHKVSADAFIDATQDADFAAMAGVPYFIGGEDIHIPDKKMAVTLMLHLKNVDWNKVKETAKSEKFGYGEVTNTAAWGFADLHYVYTPIEENTRLRGLNLAKVGDEYFINALQIFGVDGLDEESKKAAIEKGIRETDHILQFLREEFPGFEKAEVMSYPTELYVRETRHIWAEYQLSMADVWTNKYHWDTIAYGAYPVDVQAQTPQDYGYVIASPKQYGIPFRSLVPLEIDGLLVVGRSAGFSSLAAGSARVVPTGMATGEAAGAAAALALEENVSFRELSNNEIWIETLQKTLDQQGAFVKKIEADYPYKGEWYDESIQLLINYGLVVGGYTNDLRVDDEATLHGFVNMLRGAINRITPEQDAQLGNELDAIFSEAFAQENRPVELKDAATILARLYLEEGSTGEGERDWQQLVEEGIMNEKVAQNVNPDNHILTFKEMYAIIASTVQ